MQLRLMDAWLAAGLLPMLGVDCLRAGTAIQIHAGVLQVANECSGMRSIFALVALAVAIGFLDRTPFIGTVLFVIWAIAIAVLGNVLRIISIAIVDDCFGQHFALSVWHDVSGWLAFAFDMAVLLMLSGRASCRDFPRIHPEPFRTSAPGPNS